MRALARQTVAIVEAGVYVAPSGRIVSIQESVRRAAAGIRLYGPDPLPLPGVSSSSDRMTRVEVTGESGLAAARHLLRDEGLPREVLNCASARHPGDGFLNGASAQEESLCRASALYVCLLGAPEYYDDQRNHRDVFYTDRVIVSPHMPVFRNDSGGLLEEPHHVSFLTAAAPNAGVIARERPEALACIAAVLRARSAQVLAVAAHEGLQHLVLGAWGCGVFGNSPLHVASAFRAHLDDGKFANDFRRIVFAVLDPREDSPTRAAFNQVFST